MDYRRVLRHLFTDHWSVRRALPRPALRAIQRNIDAQEQRHDGQVRFAVEASLPLSRLLRGQGAHERAIEVFGQLRVWDTQHNNGVLVYLLMADKRVEIIADRGIHARVGAAAWEAICGEMQRSFEAGRFEMGVSLGVSAVSDLLATHFPPLGDNPNELPDEPVVL